MSSPASARVLARRGDAGYRQFRIPALLRTAAGTLLAVADARPLLDDLPSPIDLTIRRSEDEGNTWDEGRILRTGTGLEGFGDASLLQDPVSGAILLWHVASTRWGFFESEDGLERTQHVDLAVSHDDGLSWTFRRVTEQLKRPGIRSLFPASGAGLALMSGPHRGRLLQPMVVMVSPAQGHDAGTERIASAVAFSDDHGLSWNLGEPFDTTAEGVHTNEHSLAQLPDGSVVSCSRATPSRLWAVSNDGGASFGTPRAEPALPDPSDNGSVTALGRGDEAADGALVAVTHNRDRFLRCATSVTVGVAAAAATTPGAVQWGGSVLLEPGASGYSTAVVLSDGDLGVLFERGAYEELVFVRVPRAELEAATVRPAGSSPVGGEAAAAVATLGTPGSAEWAKEAGEAPGLPGLSVRVVPRSITPAPPESWELREEHVFLSGEAITAPASEGKEKGAAGAQLVASRADLAANLAPAGPTPGADDVITLSASARWDGEHDVVLRPLWAADGSPAGDARRASPGEEIAWLHLSRALGAGNLALRWSLTPTP